MRPIHRSHQLKRFSRRLMTNEANRASMSTEKERKRPKNRFYVPLHTVFKQGSANPSF